MIVLYYRPLSESASEAVTTDVLYRHESQQTDCDKGVFHHDPARTVRPRYYPTSRETGS